MRTAKTVAAAVAGAALTLGAMTAFAAPAQAHPAGRKPNHPIVFPDPGILHGVPAPGEGSTE